MLTGRYAIGFLAGIISLAASAYSVSLDASAHALIQSTPVQVGPLPSELVPTGIVLPSPRPLNTRQWHLLRQALISEPMNQSLFNRVHIDKVVRNGRGEETNIALDILSELGWRYTPSQQNLLLELTLKGDYEAAVDRADGLLRRQKLQAPTHAMLQQLESIPQVRRLVAEKLVQAPTWRQGYLSVLSASSPRKVIEARRLTAIDLLENEHGIERAEIAPVLNALIQTGRGRAAHHLWKRFAGLDSQQIVTDPQFVGLYAQTRDANLIPFEWTTGQGIGYTLYITREGIKISWNGRGVPVFASQLVPVTTGKRYRLDLGGRTTVGSMSNFLSPVLRCGEAGVSFQTLSHGDDRESFESDRVPNGCPLALLEIAGRVDASAGGGASIDLMSVRITETR